MSLTKVAQLGLDGIKIKPEELSIFDDLKELGGDLGDLRVDLEISPETEDEVELLEDGGELEGEISIEVDEDNTLEKSFSFTLPKIPGADDQEEIAEPEEIEVAETDDVIQVESDPWKWELKGFMSWLGNMMNDKNPIFPRHSGRDVVGLERVVAFFKRILGEISKASRMDYNNILDIGALERARDEALKAIDRCEKRIEQIEAFKRPKKKKAELENGLVKEAKASGFQINVPLFISHIARVCINSYVSAGHDIERTFMKLAEKYELTKREKAEVLQLLADMNFPVRRDRGFLLDEEIDTTSSDNFDWMANYPA